MHSGQQNYIEWAHNTDGYLLIILVAIYVLQEDKKKKITVPTQF